TARGDVTARGDGAVDIERDGRGALKDADVTARGDAAADAEVTARDDGAVDIERGGRGALKDADAHAVDDREERSARREREVGLEKTIRVGGCASSPPSIRIA